MVTWFKYPHLPDEQQIEMMVGDLTRKFTDKCIVDGKEQEIEWSYLERILGVRGDSTGQGDMPMEYLQAHSNLPGGEQSHVKFTLQSKNDMYVGFENVIFKNPNDIMRFSYPADHPLTAEFEQKMTALLREYKGDGEYLSVHHPNEPDARDDAPDATELALMGWRDWGYSFL